MKGRWRAWLRPVEPSPKLDVDDPTSWSAAQGRAVLVGVAGGARDWLRLPFGTVYGVEALDAALVENLGARRPCGASRWSTRRSRC